jgi:hypothetical protein
MKNIVKEIKVREQAEEKERPKYILPKIVTYTSEEIIEQMGPAMACSPTPCTAFT